MLSILNLQNGESAVVEAMPEEFNSRQSLLVHGLHVGGKIKLLQLYPSQNLALILQNGRKLAIRQEDCENIKVQKIDE